MAVRSTLLASTLLVSTLVASSLLASTYAVNINTYIVYAFRIFNFSVYTFNIYLCILFLWVYAIVVYVFSVYTSSVLDIEYFRVICKKSFGKITTLSLCAPISKVTLDTYQGIILINILEVMHLLNVIMQKGWAMIIMQMSHEE